jgi:hypothetical protein
MLLRMKRLNICSCLHFCKKCREKLKEAEQSLLFLPKCQQEQIFNFLVLNNIKASEGCKKRQVRKKWKKGKSESDSPLIRR